MSIARVQEWLAPLLQVPVTFGPELDEGFPGSYVVITGTPSTFTTERLFERVEFQIRAIGEQLDYGSAEALAATVDRLMDARSIRVGGLYVVEVERSAGGPSPLMVDDADRHHFVCNYYMEVESS